MTAECLVSVNETKEYGVQVTKFRVEGLFERIDSVNWTRVMRVIKDKTKQEERRGVLAGEWPGLDYNGAKIHFAAIPENNYSL